MIVLVERTIISAVIHSLSNSLSVSLSCGYAIPPFLSLTHTKTLSNSESISRHFSSALSYLAHLYSGDARNTHTNSPSHTFSCTC